MAQRCMICRAEAASEWLTVYSPPPSVSWFRSARFPSILSYLALHLPVGPHESRVTLARVHARQERRRTPGSARVPVCPDCCWHGSTVSRACGNSRLPACSHAPAQARAGKSLGELRCAHHAGSSNTYLLGVRDVCGISFTTGSVLLTLCLYCVGNAMLV